MKRKRERRNKIIEKQTSEQLILIFFLKKTSKILFRSLMWRQSRKPAGARTAARLLKPEWSRTSIRLSGSTCVYSAISAEKRSVVTSWLDVVTGAKKKTLHVSPPTEPFLLGRNDSDLGLRRCL